MRSACLLIALLVPMALTALIGPHPAQAGPLCTPPVLSAIAVREETPGFSVDVEYPVLCAANARARIRDMAGFLVADFKKLDPEHDRSFFPHKYTLHVRYAAWSAAEDRFASVKLAVSAYSGGAHGNHWPLTGVFDLATDRTIGLDDLFTDLETGLALVARLVRQPLRAALGEMYVPDMFEDGLFPMDRNFSRFVLTKEGVAFFFAPYQVAPFAAGEQVVTVPYGQLASVLATDIKETLRSGGPVALE